MWKMARVMAVNAISIANTEKDKFIMINLETYPVLLRTFSQKRTVIRRYQFTKVLLLKHFYRLPQVKAGKQVTSGLVVGV